MKGQGAILDIAATLLSIGAGVYLLTRHSISTAGLDGGQSWFEVIAHGMGIYFIAKGLWMARSLTLAADQRDRLAQIAEKGARRGRETPPESGLQSTEQAEAVGGMS